MAYKLVLDEDSRTLEHYPPHIRPWLRAVCAFGFLSFFASVSLLVLLSYRLVRWQVKSKKTNQFAVLIFNLLLADIQQSLAFLLNVEWLRLDSLVVGSRTCWIQGWLVSTGDLSSGVWCFAIGLHTMANVIFDYRLPSRYFYTLIFVLWTFIYGISAIPPGLYGNDIFVRTGVWCWIHHDLDAMRLWTHYIFIFVFEFGNVIVYAIIYTVLLRRLRSDYYTAEQAARVKTISSLMVAYPIVYVVCTLPLASARMAAMSHNPPSLARLCLSGCMITSNGWLDVLLYTLTRRITLFSDSPPPDSDGLDTFAAFWASPAQRFGNASKIEALSARTSLSATRRHWNKLSRTGGSVSLGVGNESTEAMCDIEMGKRDIGVLTETRVVSEPAQVADYAAMEDDIKRYAPTAPRGRYSEESLKAKCMELAHIPYD